MPALPEDFFSLNFIESAPVIKERNNNHTVSEYNSTLKEIIEKSNGWKMPVIDGNQKNSKVFECCSKFQAIMEKLYGNDEKEKKDLKCLNLPKKEFKKFLNITYKILNIFFSVSMNVFLQLLLTGYNSYIREEIIDNEIEAIINDVIILEKIVKEGNKTISKTLEAITREITNSMNSSNQITLEDVKKIYEEIIKGNFAKEYVTSKYLITIKKIIKGSRYNKKLSRSAIQ